MTPLVAEGGNHKVGGAVQHFGALQEARRRVDESAQPYDPYNLVEIAHRGLHMRQQVGGASACRFLAVLYGYTSTKLALSDELAAGVEADLAGYEQERADADKRDVVGDGGCRRRERDPDFCKFLFNHSS